MAGRRMSMEINAGSMADIAFLLLVFFLVTTTMDSDWGIQRLLPPIEDAPDANIIIKERNVFVVLVNANDQLLVEGDLLDVSQLKDKAKEFIVNAKKAENLPESEDVSVEIAKQHIAAPKDDDDLKKWQKLKNAASIIGPFNITKQVISLQNDRGTSYEMYIRVQDEIAQAYNELRNDMANKKFGESYQSILEKADKDPAYKEKYTAIKTVLPQRVSEAEPKITTQN